MHPKKSFLRKNVLWIAHAENQRGPKILKSPAVDLRPTRVRWRIMAMLMVTVAVATLGRLNLGILAKNIQDEFAFRTQTMGWIFSAFSFAYHPFQIPGGWAGDRYGPRTLRQRPCRSILRATRSATSGRRTEAADGISIKNG